MNQRPSPSPASYRTTGSASGSGLAGSAPVAGLEAGECWVFWGRREAALTEHEDLQGEGGPRQQGGRPGHVQELPHAQHALAAAAAELPG